MNLQLKSTLLVASAVLSSVCLGGDTIDFPFGTGMLAELPHERGALMSEATGVDFPLTTSDHTAKQFFMQGLAQLYAGDKFEAARSFREVITRDSDCAMGYWGIAMSYPGDPSLQTEYMWYASERRGHVATQFERDLIDAYNVFFGTDTEPTMVLVDAETGRRRARPVHLGRTNINSQRFALARQLEQLVDKHPEEAEAVPLVCREFPESAIARRFQATSPLHPLQARMALWHPGTNVSLDAGFRHPGFAGVWNAVGACRWKNQKRADAALAFEAGCRVSNAWLKAHEAMPYERSHYVQQSLNLAAVTTVQSLRERLESQQTAVPRHPQPYPPADDFFAIPNGRSVQNKQQGDPPGTSAELKAVEDLGPLFWTPPQMPTFTLPRGTRPGMMGAENFDGPTIVVFYLGFGCIHCVEQLNELRPRYQDFKAAGIEVVAIGTDPVDRVRASLLDEIEVGGPRTPFEILCDTQGQVFQQFHCRDEFTDEPLHGTFLIDSQGRILWRDISEEPFMQTDFLLEESQRLIALWDGKH